jgi:acetate kinase
LVSRNLRRVNDLAAHLYLAHEKKLDAAMMEDLVDRRSGLLGISGQRSNSLLP